MNELPLSELLNQDKTENKTEEGQGHSLWEHDLHYFEKHGIIAGIDEAGRGPLAGSVTAACVILDLAKEPLEGLDDSKKLTDKRRRFLAKEIRKNALAYGIGTATPSEIDERNILIATFMAMERALVAVQQKIETIGLVLIDGNQCLPQYTKAQKYVIKGDGKSSSIAAASILAKVARDDECLALEEVYPGYGFAKHKGYGTAEHREAIEALGPCKAHRKSFLSKLSQQTELSLF